jgi:hypothetical protein
MEDGSRDKLEAILLILTVLVLTAIYDWRHPHLVGTE